MSGVLVTLDSNISEISNASVTRVPSLNVSFFKCQFFMGLINEADNKALSYQTNSIFSLHVLRKELLSAIIEIC